MKSPKWKIDLEQLNNKYNNHSIAFSFKRKDGKKTHNKCVTFYVEKKKALHELSENEVIPSSLVIDGIEYPTDVEECDNFKFLACYTSNDPEILRLQGDPELLTPLKGGQEIVMFPTNWEDQGGGIFSFTVGTLGFFAIDNEDDKLVGVTNAHVVCKKKVIASDRTEEDLSETYNTIEEIEWIVDEQNYPPGALCRDGGNITSPNSPGKRIKRYSPFRLSGPNYTDVALLIMDSNFIDSTSYRIHHPTTEVEYTDHMPFATSAEIDDLLNSDPNLYSVGRTTGPKGWGSSSDCILKVRDIAVSSNISDPEVESSIPFSDGVSFEYEDESDFPINSGDSGSVVVADFSGTRKIIGIAFAGSTKIGLMCRIDRVADELNIREWDNSYTLDESDELVPTMIKYPISAATSSEKTIELNGDTYYQAGTSPTDEI
jgi:hypothetical protein